MSINHYFANMRIAEKFALGKSADISQNVHLDELFQNLKNVTWDFSDILEVIQAHCAIQLQIFNQFGIAKRKLC